jgi:hypothetical protein
MTIVNTFEERPKRSPQLRLGLVILASEKIGHWGDTMSFIDVAIPAIIGFVAFAWPQAMFYGSRTAPPEPKIRLIRLCGAGLLAVAALYLFIKLASG